MRFIRIFLIAILSGGVFASGVLASYSSAQMAGSQNIIICGNNGTAEITLGANGEPITHHHTCVDCCQVFFGEMPNINAGIFKAIALGIRIRLEAVTTTPLIEAGQANARAPPLNSI